MATNQIDGALLKQMCEYGAKNLELNKQKVDELNVFPVPDGDTGTNMSLTFNYAVEELDRLEQFNLYAVAKTAASGALIGARGNSGVILSQLLRGLAEGCKGKAYLDIGGVAEVVRMAADAAYKAVMKPIEGTILTVAREMAEFAVDKQSEYKELSEFVSAIIEQGRDALNRTPELLPVLKEAGVVDSGGQGLVCIMEGAYLALTGENLSEEVVLNTSGRERFVDDSGMRPEDITFGYCTEFIIKDAQEADDDELRNYLNTIGDCVLVVKSDDIIKVHVHTDHPGQAFEKGLSCGPLTRMKVDNMREMLGADASKEKQEQQEVEKTAERLPYAAIAVSPGEGLSEIFKSVGVTTIISGGQTMNPSTQDFLNEVKKINADVVYIFPNNSNIIMAANQAKEISDENIVVIPTKTFPQCITAMLAFDSQIDPEDNAVQMTEALQTVKTGEVTFAVRNTKFNGLKIKKGDIIGIFNGEIQVKGNDPETVTKELLDIMVDEDSSLVSIYYGEDVSEDDAEAFGSVVENEFEDQDVEIQFGGQPLYYYIVSVE